MLKPIRANWLTDTERKPARSSEPRLVPIAKPTLLDEPGSLRSSPIVAELTPTRPERRARARQALDSSATIFFIKTGSKLSGRIADLSLGGCRIRCDACFPVGIYTRVEAEFCLEGIPFRLGGVVQAIHDRFTVGIRFLDISSRKREQMEQLIGELNESMER